MIVDDARGARPAGEPLSVRRGALADAVGRRLLVSGPLVWPDALRAQVPRRGTPRPRGPIKVAAGRRPSLHEWQLEPDDRRD